MAITTTGSGAAQIFQNGTAVSAQWSKASQHAPLEFTDESGQDIAINQGNVWISVLPTTRTASYQ